MRLALDPEWQFLASGIGVLAVLLLAPGGLAGLAYQARDRWLRAVAARSGMSVAATGRRSSPTAGSSLAGDEVTGAESAASLGAGPSASGTARPGAARRGRHRGRCAPVLFGVDLAVRGGRGRGAPRHQWACSTLLRAISASPAAAGHDHVRRRGLSPGWRTTRWRRASRRCLAAGVFLSLTVDENLQVAGWLHGAVAGTAAELAWVRERSSVRRPGPRPASNLSGGQQQMSRWPWPWSCGLAADEDHRLAGLAPRSSPSCRPGRSPRDAEASTLVVVEQSGQRGLEIAERGVFLERGQVVVGRRRPA